MTFIYDFFLYTDINDMALQNKVWANEAVGTRSMQGLPLLLYYITCSNRDRGRIRNISQDVVKIFLEEWGSLTTYVF